MFGRAPTTGGRPQLVLPREIVNRLETVCQSWLQADVLHGQEFAVRRGVLLFGPPGTGKSLIARTIEGQSGLPFVRSTGGQLSRRGFIGVPTTPARELFREVCATAPCILFIDEIELIAPRPGSAEIGEFADERREDFVAQMDGMEKLERPVFMLAATNVPDRVDEAVLSRFTQRVEIPLPDEQGRRQILQDMLAKTPSDFDADQVSTELAGMTHDFSGRDLGELIRRATFTAVDRAIDVGEVMINREDLTSQLPDLISLLAARQLQP